jgi:hypothetical protein
MRQYITSEFPQDPKVGTLSPLSGLAVQPAITQARIAVFESFER